MQEEGGTVGEDQVLQFPEVPSSVPGERQIWGANEGDFVEIGKGIPKIMCYLLHHRLLENPTLDDHFHVYEIGILLSGNPGG